MGQGDGRFTDVQGPMVDGVDGDLWVWGEVTCMERGMSVRKERGAFEVACEF